MAYRMLVDIDRCIGCWTCAMGCKVGNHLEDDEYRVEARGASVWELEDAGGATRANVTYARARK